MLVKFRDFYGSVRRCSMVALSLLVLSGIPAQRASASDNSGNRSGRNSRGKSTKESLPSPFAGSSSTTNLMRKKSKDERLRALLTKQAIVSVDAGPLQNPSHVKLGQALFFDKELSGNRDTACSTCHHPFLATGDELSLSVGTAAKKDGTLGEDRKIGDGRSFAPRNAPAVFNLGSPEWVTQYWDGRIAETDTGFISPAGSMLPKNLPNVIAIQAMFPVTSRVEMRGLKGDLDVYGNHNELADIDDNDLPLIWDAIAARLLSLPGYQTLFAEAFPGETVGFEHAAIAIAAFEAEAFTYLDSPWDRYLTGNNRALSSSQKNGALLFFGSAGCSSCHSGSLLTDQQFHNLGVPQFGPGKGAEAPLDFGRARVTGKPQELFKFRTPPLRNCEVTGPYMHNGAYRDLEDAIAHHAEPITSLNRYQVDSHVEQDPLRSTYDQENQVLVAGSINLLKLPTHLSKKEIRHLADFMKALTAPKIQQRLDATIPVTVPSGLPVD
jgi:cytochrome c peroxidase